MKSNLCRSANSKGKSHEDIRANYLDSPNERHASNRVRDPVERSGVVCAAISIPGYALEPCFPACHSHPCRHWQHRRGVVWRHQSGSLATVADAQTAASVLTAA